MVTIEQALDVLDKFQANKPTRFFNKVDEISAGMTFALVYLRENRGEAYASTIADAMNISRARVAVIIQKLTAKGLIEQTASNNDARIKALKITDKGLNEVNQFRQHMIMRVTRVIEEVGLKEVYRFLETSKKIKNIMDEMDREMCE